MKILASRLDGDDLLFRFKCQVCLFISDWLPLTDDERECPRCNGRK